MFNVPPSVCKIAAAAHGRCRRVAASAADAVVVIDAAAEREAERVGETRESWGGPGEGAGSRHG